MPRGVHSYYREQNKIVTLFSLFIPFYFIHRLIKSSLILKIFYPIAIFLLFKKKKKKDVLYILPFSSNKSLWYKIQLKDARLLEIVQFFKY